MIVVDTSALIEIALAASRAQDCRQALVKADRLLISAATVSETLIVALGRGVEAQMSAVFDRFGLIVVPLTDRRARMAAAAYQRFGKRRHPAALNFGDCFAYALAKEHGCPLLFVGEDFARTDIQPALS